MPPDTWRCKIIGASRCYEKVGVTRVYECTNKTHSLAGVVPQALRSAVGKTSEKSGGKNCYLRQQTGFSPVSRAAGRPPGLVIVDGVVSWAGRCSSLVRAPFLYMISPLFAYIVSQSAPGSVCLSVFFHCISQCPALKQAIFIECVSNIFPLP